MFGPPHFMDHSPLIKLFCLCLQRVHDAIIGGASVAELRDSYCLPGGRRSIDEGRSVWTGSIPMHVLRGQAFSEDWRVTVIRLAFLVGVLLMSWAVAAESVTYRYGYLTFLPKAAHQFKQYVLHEFRYVTG